MLLGPTGLVNEALQSLGMAKVRLLYTETAIVIAVVHVMLPFMVIPVLTSLQKLDPMFEAAAWTLGASRFTALRRVVMPQVTMGLLSGSLVVFGLSASAFVIPGLLGGRRLKVAATLVYDQYMHELNWPMGAAIAILLLIANLAIMCLDRSVEQPALTLGASDWTVFRRVTMPMILPGITGGWLLAFINSFDELTMSIFVTSPATVTLPVRMYMYATESIDPMMAAVSALMIALTAAAMLLLDRVFGLDKILVGQN